MRISSSRRVGRGLPFSGHARGDPGVRPESTPTDLNPCAAHRHNNRPRLAQPRGPETRKAPRPRRPASGSRAPPPCAAPTSAKQSSPRARAPPRPAPGTCPGPLHLPSPGSKARGRRKAWRGGQGCSPCPRGLPGRGAGHPRRRPRGRREAGGGWDAREGGEPAGGGGRGEGAGGGKKVAESEAVRQRSPGAAAAGSLCPSPAEIRAREGPRRQQRRRRRERKRKLQKRKRCGSPAPAAPRPASPRRPCARAAPPAPPPQRAPGRRAAPRLQPPLLFLRPGGGG
ncbi:PREDICTED: translation initiation factor IF-2-like, partial [Chinchilla lanigera]|uniref:translation initiation factor IF-2-like n=1 Tax=Chinchilla lanigera TaxID=34839 RepID=UPI00069856FC